VGTPRTLKLGLTTKRWVTHVVLVQSSKPSLAVNRHTHGLPSDDHYLVWGSASIELTAYDHDAAQAMTARKPLWRRHHQ
jgi:hypothetical protein